AELPCWPGDDTWSATDADLAQRVAADLLRAGLPDPGAIEVVVRRLPAVYPVYERSTTEARAEVDRWLASIPGVLSFGRQGLGVPDNLHHVLDMGQAAAANLDGALGGTTTRLDWERELARFATNVVVD
ncbi:MAG: FAD-dependent oxidoreductase, partial [Actinomycetota bacterium]